MGTYVSIRGWLEVGHDQRPAVQAVIDRHHHDRYSGGWAFPAKPSNWLLYVFFGGDLRAGDEGWLDRQVRELALLEPIDPDDGFDDRPRGLFVVTDERGACRLWSVRGGDVAVDAMPSLGWLGE